MEALLHYLTYILGVGIAVLILVCLLDGGGARKDSQTRRPTQGNRTPVG